MANIQIPSLSNTVWKFNDILSATTRCAITFQESEEGAGDNSIGYIYINGRKIELTTTMVFKLYSTVIIPFNVSGNTNTLVYVKTTDSLYLSTTQEGEGWYFFDSIEWRKLDSPKIYLVLEQAYSTTQTVADDFLTELQANATQANFANTGWKFHSECNYFGDGNTEKLFNVNYLSNYDKTSRTQIKTPSIVNNVKVATIELNTSSGYYLKTTDGLYTQEELTTGEGWYSSSDGNLWIKQSSPPSIIITGDTDVSSFDFILWLLDNADEVDIIRVDLSDSIKIAGTHTIQVKARASGYRDSEFSNSVNYVVIAPESKGEE